MICVQVIETKNQQLWMKFLKEQSVRLLEFGFQDFLQLYARYFLLHMSPHCHWSIFLF